jgi:hypothetical protein
MLNFLSKQKSDILWLRIFTLDLISTGCTSNLAVNCLSIPSDGSIRLVRDVPMGNSAWKTLYPRTRNAVEGRNATFEDWGFKCMPVYGMPRAKALIFLADVLDTLTTLARLVREATLACRVT